MRDKTSLACLLLDIDYFKQFNDVHGHLTGDDRLKLVASLIEQEIKRVSDMAFRYGGEEFAVLPPNTQADGALVIAEKIRRRIDSAGFQSRGRQIPITISIGVAACTPIKEVTTENTLVAQADTALYRSKQLGRNRVSVYQQKEQTT